MYFTKWMPKVEVICKQVMLSTINVTIKRNVLFINSKPKQLLETQHYAYFVLTLAISAFMYRKIIIVQVYGDNPKYETLDDEMITRMLRLPPDKKRLHDEQSAHQSRSIQQSTRQTTRVSMTSWIRSKRRPVCIHISNSISPRGTKEGILCHPFQMVGPKSCQQDSIRSQVSAADV